jgi:hypothetical protein
MKIKSLNITSLKYLQNISFDFTYPEAHPNAGKPLDKICIIGQSATGKTSILELIKDCITELKSAEIANNKFLWEDVNLSFIGEVEFLNNNESFKISNETITKDGKTYKQLTDVTEGTIENLIDTGVKLMYLSADLISKEAINIFDQNPIEILNKSDNSKTDEETVSIDSNNYIYEFGHQANAELWFSLLNKILNYRKSFTQLAAELVNKGIIGDLGKLTQQLIRWSEENKNPLIPFAEYFNPILKKLGLEVDLINTEYSIPIKSKENDKVIPVSNLSTGTKGLLLTMFPLFELDTTDSIILLDEPERSLFPDMQIDLLSHYQKIAPKAQFIVATHSPFIAAAFEPEERFILYFDENGKVSVRRGESPIGDDPNDILRNDFNVDYYNDFGKEAYRKYLDLRSKVSEETEPEKKKALLVELTQLGDKYNF